MSGTWGDVALKPEQKVSCVQKNQILKTMTTTLNSTMDIIGNTYMII